MPYPEPRGNEHEATRFHRSAWWCGCLMATRCACPAACKAGDRIPGAGIPIDVRLPYRGNPARFARFRLCRGHEYHNRVPLAEGRYERLPELAAELVRSNVDLIITHGTPGSLAAKRATTTIPIVMANIGDPVATGVVASIARPGGNITGQTFSIRSSGQKESSCSRR